MREQDVGEVVFVVADWEAGVGQFAGDAKLLDGCIVSAQRQ